MKMGFECIKKRFTIGIQKWVLQQKSVDKNFITGIHRVEMIFDVDMHSKGFHFKNGAEYFYFNNVLEK